MRRGQSEFPHELILSRVSRLRLGRACMGWAWGFSRIVDYLETQPFVDKNKLIALGHSRLGKLTMVATAFDERISLGAPAGSSGAGTGAYRFCGPGRGGKEGIEDMTRKFGYYFVPRLAEFTGQMQKLPFDAHWFVALTAPRPWISVEGTDDQNCVPNAVKQSVLAAQAGLSISRREHGSRGRELRAASPWLDSGRLECRAGFRRSTIARHRSSPQVRSISGRANFNQQRRAEMRILFIAVTVFALAIAAYARPRRQ